MGMASALFTWICPINPAAALISLELTGSAATQCHSTGGITNSPQILSWASDVLTKQLQAHHQGALQGLCKNV